MKLLKGIELDRQVSKKANKWKDIKSEALELLAFLDEKQGKFDGEYVSCYALHHSQVSNDHYNFFVIAKNIHGKDKGQFMNRVIVNPIILESPEKIEQMIPVKDFLKKPDDKVNVGFKMQKQIINNVYDPVEGCMSFPQRKGKHMDRFFKIKVQYQIPILGGLILLKRTEWLEGLKAHIFQHEVDHANGITQFYNNK